MGNLLSGLGGLGGIGSMMGGLGGGLSKSGMLGLMVNQQQQEQNNYLSIAMQKLEGQKTRENMLRSTMKKLTEMEQEMRQEEMKATQKAGEGWVKSLGG